MIRYSLAIALGLFVLASCSHFSDTKKPDTVAPGTSGIYEKIIVKGKLASRAERARCEAAGGTVGPGGMLGYDQCVQLYPDAGASCQSETDCLGRCLLSPDSKDDVDQPTDDGICQATDSPFGCYAEVHEGKVHWTICVD
jgi:hypothetical protein